MSQTCHEETHAPQLLPLGLGRFLTPFCLEHNRSGAHGILSTAVVLTMTDPKAFKTGREFAAWIGLVPRQNSTGGKERLGSISKQGDRYLCLL